MAADQKSAASESFIDFFNYIFRQKNTVNIAFISNLTEYISVWCDCTAGFINALSDSVVGRNIRRSADTVINKVIIGITALNSVKQIINQLEILAENLIS